MADDESLQSQNIWPISNSYFSVDIGDQKNLAFQEILGLDVESKVIEYQNGNSPQFSTIKMPEMFSSRNVTLKKGVFVKDNCFWDWFNQINTKISGVDLKSEGREVAVESLELAHEGIAIANE